MNKNLFAYLVTLSVVLGLSSCLSKGDLESQSMGTNTVSSNNSGSCIATVTAVSGFNSGLAVGMTFPCVALGVSQTAGAGIEASQSSTVTNPQFEAVVEDSGGGAGPSGQFDFTDSSPGAEGTGVLKYNSTNGTSSSYQMSVNLLSSLNTNNVGNFSINLSNFASFSSSTVNGDEVTELAITGSANFTLSLLSASVNDVAQTNVAGTATISLNMINSNVPLTDISTSLLTDLGGQNFTDQGNCTMSFADGPISYATSCRIALASLTYGGESINGETAPSATLNSLSFVDQNSSATNNIAFALPITGSEIVGKTYTDVLGYSYYSAYITANSGSYIDSCLDGSVPDTAAYEPSVLAQGLQVQVTYSSVGANASYYHGTLVAVVGCAQSIIGTPGVTKTNPTLRISF